MTKAELLSTYVLPLLVTALTALAGFIGAQIKTIYRRWVDDKTKEAVVRTCVKGIPITQLEMDLLIESVVAEFNIGLFSGGDTQ